MLRFKPCIDYFENGSNFLQEQLGWEANVIKIRGEIAVFIPSKTHNLLGLKRVFGKVVRIRSFSEKNTKTKQKKTQRRFCCINIH